MSLTEFLRFIANPFQYRLERNEAGIEKILNELSILQDIRKGQEEMALNLEALRAEVERAKTVQESAVTLLHALAAEVAKVAADLALELDEDNTHVAALDELATKLRTSTDELAAGIAASDDVFEVPAPVEPAPVEAPVEAHVEAPVEPAPEVPAEPVAEVPVETPVETPVEEVPVEAPVEAPVEPAPEAPVEEVPAEPAPEAPVEEVPPAQ